MRVALYPRVSTQEQFLNGHSIQEQTERMEKYCEAMGWTVYKVYTDAGFSGANTERPALQRMIRDIKKGKVDKVLVYKLDRLSRSQKDTLMLIEDVFLANNCDFVSMSENFDTSTPFGRAMIGILAVFAQLEREQIKERMAMGKEARAKLGKFHGSSSVPIGYDYIDGNLVVNDFEKMQIKYIYNEYANGKSPRVIAKELNEAGEIHKFGKWQDKAIRAILTKKTYLGYIIYKDTWYKGDHESIIDEELFEKVQEIREQKAKQHAEKRLRAGRATSYLAGYMFCDKCNAKYSKTTKMTKGHRYNYYTCNSRTKSTPYLVKDPNCKNKNWRMDDLDAIVFGEIKKLALDPDYIAELKEMKIEDERPKVINTEIKKLDDQLARLMDLYTIGQMPVDILQDKVHGLNDQKLKLEAELDKIEEENKQKMSHAETVAVVKSFEDVLNRGDFDEIRMVIGTLIDRIEIDGENITIHWAFI